MFYWRLLSNLFSALLNIGILQLYTTELPRIFPKWRTVLVYRFVFGAIHSKKRTPSYCTTQCLPRYKWQTYKNEQSFREVYVAYYACSILCLWLLSCSFERKRYMVYIVQTMRQEGTTDWAIESSTRLNALYLKS